MKLELLSHICFAQLLVTQVPPSLKVHEDAEVTFEKIKQILKNNGRLRELRYFDQDKTTGKGKLKAKVGISLLNLFVLLDTQPQNIFRSCGHVEHVRV